MIVIKNTPIVLKYTLFVNYSIVYNWKELNIASLFFMYVGVVVDPPPLSRRRGGCCITRAPPRVVSRVAFRVASRVALRVAFSFLVVVVSAILKNSSAAIISF